MRVYYNDNDPFVAQWLRNLVAAKRLPAGDVDERDINEVKGDDIRGYGQCHFFAGIGGWPYALQLAGWGDRPCWTASVPCQPFSVAGKGKGTADRRHLWPAFFALVAECRPLRIFGEQVTGAIGQGWLDGISGDLEGEGYAVGAVVLGAHSVGAPHIRQRLFWVADAERDSRDTRRLADESGESAGAPSAGPSSEPGRCGVSSGLGDTNGARSQGRREHLGEHPDQPSPWASGVFIECTDGKARRIEPGIQPLAHGFPNRVGILRGAGNAIVPQVAAAFVSAFMECRS